MRSIVVVVVLLMAGVAHGQSFEAVPLSGGRAFAVGDLNGDGLLDVMTPSTSTPGVLVFLADGQGGFRLPVHHPLNAAQAAGDTGFAAGDFDRDGRLDLAVATGSGIVTLLRGDGTGGFAAPAWTGIAPGVVVSRLAIADLTGDGVPDLVAGVANRSHLEVLQGDGAGSFILGYAIIACGQGSVAGDFTNDGYVDVLGTCPSTGPQLARGNGTRTFTATPVEGMTEADAVAVADFNRDGIKDFMFTANGRAFVVMRHDPAVSGGQVIAISLPATSGDDAGSAAAGDFNGDGHLDAAFGGRGQNIYVALGDGQGGFGSASVVPTSGGNLVQIEARDLNGDRRDDLVLRSADPAGLQVLFAKSTASDQDTAAALSRLEAAVGSVSGALDRVASKVDAIQMPNVEKLDAAVSSRASAQAVEALEAKLDMLTGLVADRLEGAVLRVSIEQELIKGDRLSSLYLPAQYGGVLEQVRAVLVDAIERNEAAKLSIDRARVLLRVGDELLQRQDNSRKHGDDRFAAAKYRLVFDAYAAAYQSLVK
jgi:hypothetical protein